MGLTKWQDCTTYSRDDQERIPTSWRIKHGLLDIVITCGHIHHRGNWIMHCFAVGISTKPITTFIDSCKFIAGDDLKTVQARAIEMVEVRLDEIRDDMIVIKREAEK